MSWAEVELRRLKEKNKGFIRNKRGNGELQLQGDQSTGSQELKEFGTGPDLCVGEKSTHLIKGCN